jgi:hypothetical protein
MTTKAGEPNVKNWAATIALVVSSAAAAADNTLCREAAAQAAAESGVPVAVLLAVTLTETGRRMDGQDQPWPWTVNVAGAGHWFSNAAETLAFMREQIAAGRNSFDIGCFQINHRWHGAAFASLDAMLDPVTNARYAARFLADLHAETGDWSSAAGAFHSRTAALADRYRARFDAHYQNLVGTTDSATPILLARREEPETVNRFPLLQGGATGQLGSLVPLGAGG